MTLLTERSHAMIWGALVADAASMGLHWIYDQARIAEVAGERPEFHGPDAADFEGAKGYFAHGGRRRGMQSQYGEQVLVMLRSLAATGPYDRATYEAMFQAHFGYGGAYVGYIDRATRDTLDNLAQADRMGGVEAATFYGSDDTQLPAVAKLPPLIATGQVDEVTSAIRVTNNSDQAEAYGRVVAAMLQAAVQGAAPAEVVKSGLSAAAPEIAEGLARAVQATGQSVPEFTAEVGMACELAFGVPSVMHALLVTGSFTEAVRQNILAGGDSCGRAVVLGAILGACHGIGGDQGIPVEWVDALAHRDDVRALMDECAGAGTG
ncbi:ADP-ribosylglycohydrolase family protein [Tropicibacter sp. R16_0]|uniref:ADP-ribosylglycohydrolase family protein n=1 Tax=Tropicibacter sp. R16_0 TaxID=2821102 RepID=UPI001ADB7982|nr:ADP-ribosylglycohydrolase family protein [Tropicibacter sp. R16_0]MBO9452803.1 ADP-ribosylglycohydrolase family protein [Tropicibacter sp. R16_0]